MKTKESHSKYASLYSNYVRVNMAVFRMPASSMKNQSKSKLFCEKIINIYQSVSKDKRVFIC